MTINAELPQSPTPDALSPIRHEKPAGESDRGEEIVFIADKIRVNGPKVDGGYSVTFEVGEYEQAKVAEMLKIPQQTNVSVIVKQDE